MSAAEYEQRIREAFDARQLASAAQGALEAYGPEILSFLASRLPSSSDASEVFSMFAEDLWTGLPNFEWRCSIRTWLYALARNAAARYMVAPQRDRARNLAVSRVESVSALVERVRSTTDVYQRTAVKDRFRELRKQLEPDDQMLLILRVDRGLSFRDLAIAMRGDVNLDDATLASETVRLRKAFERVKTELRTLAQRAGLLTRDD